MFCVGSVEMQIRRSMEGSPYCRYIGSTKALLYFNLYKSGWFSQERIANVDSIYVNFFGFFPCIICEVLNKNNIQEMFLQRNHD